MKISLALVIETLQSLALAIWLGGQAALIVLLSVGYMPHQFEVRESSIIELCGIIMVGVQYLTRRRYVSNKPLFLVDGFRHLLTFAALLLSEYMKYGVKVKSGTAATATEMVVAGAQIAILTVVSAMGMWLQVAAARAGLNVTPAPVKSQINENTPITPQSSSSKQMRPRPARGKK